MPRKCAVCGRELLYGEKIVCLRCNSDMPLTFFWSLRDNEMHERLYGRTGICHAVALFFFRNGSEFNNLVYKIKYSGRCDIGTYLGKILGKKLLESCRDITPDECRLVPIPLHPLKRLKRGYNQSMVITEGIKSATGIRIAANPVLRRRNTVSQTSIGIEEKWDNISGAFIARRSSGIWKDLSIKHIIVVDDVVTSGSTMEACCSVIKSLRPDIKIHAASIAFVE